MSSIIHHIINITVKHDSTWEKKFLLQSVNARNVVLTSSRKKQLPTWNCMARNQMPLRDEKRKKISTLSFLSLFLSLLFVQLFNVGLWLSPKKKKTKRILNRKKNWKKKKNKMAVARCGVNCFEIVVYSFLLFLSRHTFMIDKIVQEWRKFTIRIFAWFRLNKRLHSSYTVFPSMLERFLVKRLICNKEVVDKKKTRWDF